MKYRHIKTGNLYFSILIANKHSKKPGFPEMMVYKNQQGEVFARPLVEFNEKFRKVDA